MRGAYFEVTTGAEWAKIVDLKIWTYKTRGLQVYVKDGEATNYEQVPCSWKRIAETSATWNPGYWKKVYPPWMNGFDPVVMKPYSTKSFYVVNISPGYGTCLEDHVQSTASSRSTTENSFLQGYLERENHPGIPTNTTRPTSCRPLSRLSRTSR